MARLVDAGQVAEAITWLNEYDSVIWHDVMERINKLPTVEAAPVRYGQWKGKPIAGYSTVKCSECGDVFMENSGKWNYCPNCGAKMNENEWEEPEINPCRGCIDYDGRGGCKSNGGCGVTDEVN